MKSRHIKIGCFVLEGINAQQPVLPDGSQRALKLRLADRSELKLSIHPSD